MERVQDLGDLGSGRGRGAEPGPAGAPDLEEREHGRDGDEEAVVDDQQGRSIAPRRAQREHQAPVRRGAPQQSVESGGRQREEGTDRQPGDQRGRLDAGREGADARVRVRVGEEPAKGGAGGDPEDDDQVDAQERRQSGLPPPGKHRDADDGECDRGPADVVEVPLGERLFAEQRIPVERAVVDDEVEREVAERLVARKGRIAQLGPVGPEVGEGNEQRSGQEDPEAGGERELSGNATPSSVTAGDEDGEGRQGEEKADLGVALTRDGEEGDQRTDEDGEPPPAAPREAHRGGKQQREHGVGDDDGDEAADQRTEHVAGGDRHARAPQPRRQAKTQRPREQPLGETGAEEADDDRRLGAVDHAPQQRRHDHDGMK